MESRIGNSVRPPPSTAYIRPSALHTRYLAMVARTPEARNDVYALRYASYLDGGFIQPSLQQSFTDCYDRLKSSITIVVYQDERAVASVRVCLMSAPVSGVLPAADTFPDEVRRIFAGSRGGGYAPVAEINRLVRSPEAANNQGLVFLLYRLAGVVLLAAGSVNILSCVRPNHLSFYKRIRFREVAGPRVYPGLKCPMYLLAGSRADYDAVRATFPLLDPKTLPIGGFAEFLSGEPIVASLTGQAHE